MPSHFVNLIHIFHFSIFRKTSSGEGSSTFVKEQHMCDVSVKIEATYTGSIVVSSAL